MIRTQTEIFHDIKGSDRMNSIIFTTIKKVNTWPVKRIHNFVDHEWRQSNIMLLIILTYFFKHIAMSTFFNMLLIS